MYDYTPFVSLLELLEEGFFEGVVEDCDRPSQLASWLVTGLLVNEQLRYKETISPLDVSDDARLIPRSLAEKL
jgi:hypothetical protein